MCCPAPVLNRIPAERQTAPSARNPRQPDPPPSHHAPPLSPRPARRVPALARPGPRRQRRGESAGVVPDRHSPLARPSWSCCRGRFPPFTLGMAAPLRSAHTCGRRRTATGRQFPSGSAVRARHRGTTAAARGRERRAPPRSAARRGCPGGRPPGRGRRSERHLLFSQRNNSEARRSAPGSLFGGRA